MGDEQRYSARLDYDLIVVTFEDGGLSIAPGEISNIKWCEWEIRETRWVVRVINTQGTSFAWWHFVEQQEAVEWHAHLHNLWRDARIVAARAR